MKPGYETILTEEALGFLAMLHRRFEPTRRALMQAREERQRWLDRGNELDFPAETSAVRDGDWQIKGTPADLRKFMHSFANEVVKLLTGQAAAFGTRLVFADAGRMLRLLSGRRHEVLTGVCLTGPGPFEREAVVRTAVAFAPLTDEEIGWYVATGEPVDKAGAYAVQGLASRFVERIEGSHPNVVGLPVELVYAWCREVGIRIS